MKKIILTLGAVVFTSVMVQAQKTAATTATTTAKKVEQTTYSGADANQDANQTTTSTKKAMGEETKKAMIEVEKQKADYKKQAKSKAKANNTGKDDN